MNGLLARLRALPLPFRLVTGAVVALVIAGTIVTSVVTHVPRAALFANALRPEQLAEVEERLAEWNTPFSPSADNVIVDAEHRNELLLRLSLAGVPHAHVETTNEALANVGVLTPQTVIDAQTRSGLAGDIAIGLRGVEGVDDARVIIAPAKAAEFADESSREATASVRLRLHPGAALDRTAVAGIRAFVAASVGGLEPSHVTILDDRGTSSATENTPVTVPMCSSVRCNRRSMRHSAAGTRSYAFTLSTSARPSNGVKRAVHRSLSRRSNARVPPNRTTALENATKSTTLQKIAVAKRTRPSRMPTRVV